MSKSLVGVVASDKADKTITVAVTTRKTHPLYKKQYTKTKKFMAHDEANEARVGDMVVIAETRPLSARKRFVLRKVLEKAPIRHSEAEAPEETAPIKNKLPEPAKPAAKTSKEEETSDV
jgi:small subunit ribosomal protein S17